MSAPWAVNYAPATDARDLAIGNDGAILTAGNFRGTVDFDPTDGVDERSVVGDCDAYVTNLNGDGTYAWTYTVAGLEIQQAGGVSVASDGSILISGGFQDTADFDPTEATDERTAVGNFNAFVVKLSAGGSYLWAVVFGEGTDSVGGSDIAIDGDGNLLVAGFFSGTADFDPGPGIDLHTATPLAQLAGMDIFITKLDGDGAYQWTRTIGAPGADRAREVGVDAVGNIYVAGTFRGIVDFDPGKGEDFHTVMGNIEDLFVTKLFPDGSYAWTRTFPVRLGSGGSTLAVDDDGTVYVTSGFGETVDLDPTEGVDFRTPIGETDIFVSKLNADGSYGWTWSVGGIRFDRGYGVSVDDADNVFITGDFEESVDFDAGPGIDMHTSRGQGDIFVTRLDVDGSYGWTHRVGGDRDERGQYLAVDGDGGVVVAGVFGTWVMDFDPSCQVLERAVHCPLGSDTFVSKLTCFDPSADFDGDGDLSDVANYQTCFTGPQQEEPVSCPTGCATFDFIPDDTINLLDLPALQAAMQGP